MKKIETVAAKVFNIKEQAKHPKVPTSIRILHKKKLKLSKQLDNARTPSKLVSIRKDLMIVEAELFVNRNNFLKKKKMKQLIT